VKSKASTKIGGEVVSIELVSDELGGVEDHPDPSQGLSYLPVSGGKLIQSLGLSRYGLLRPIQGKALQYGGVVFSGTHLEELPFHPLNEFWKRVRMMRPATPEKLIQRLLPYFFTSKK